MLMGKYYILSFDKMSCNVYHTLKDAYLDPPGSASDTDCVNTSGYKSTNHRKSLGIPYRAVLSVEPVLMLLYLL